MRGNNIFSIIAATLLLSISAIASADNRLSYEDTIALIRTTMMNNPSPDRNESYRYIKFDKCTLEYNVTGTFPAGDLYDITFSGIDFSGLNIQNSKTGSYYAGIVMLNFKDDIHYKNFSQDLTIHTVVVSTSDDEKAAVLHKAFLHLGELCGASQSL